MQFRSLQVYLVLGLLVWPRADSGRHESVETDLFFDTEDRTETDFDLEAVCDKISIFKKIADEDELIDKDEWLTLFTAMDANKDTSVSEQEMTDYLFADKQCSAYQLQFFFKKFDADRNDAISEKEWAEAWGTLDANSDGKIDEGEWSATFTVPSCEGPIWTGGLGMFKGSCNGYIIQEDSSGDKLYRSTQCFPVVAARFKGCKQSNTPCRCPEEQRPGADYDFMFVTNQLETQGEGGSLYDTNKKDGAATSKYDDNLKIIEGAASLDYDAALKSCTEGSDPCIPPLSFGNTVIISMGSSSTQVYYQRPDPEPSGKFYNVGRTYKDKKGVQIDFLHGELQRMIKDIAKIMAEGSETKYNVWFENSVGYMARTTDNDKTDGVLFEIPDTEAAQAKYKAWFDENPLKDRNGVLSPGKILGSFSVAQFTESAIFITDRLREADNLGGVYVHNRAKTSNPDAADQYIHPQLDMSWTDGVVFFAPWHAIVDLGGGSWKVFVDGKRIYDSNHYDTTWNTNKMVMTKDKTLDCGETGPNGLRSVLQHIMAEVDREVLGHESLKDKGIVKVLIAMTGKGREAMYKGKGAFKADVDDNDSSKCAPFRACTDKDKKGLTPETCKLTQRHAMLPVFEDVMHTNAYA